ncbi:MAG: hypothetical protein ABXS91_07210 [Sulfurimonas sp.]
MDRGSYIKPFGTQQVFSFLVVCLLLFSVEGKAQEGVKKDQTKADILEEWDEFVPKNVTVPDTKLSSIVIYRPSELKGKAINVYIDGEYQASLLPGAYTQAIVCPGNHQIVTAYTNPATRYREKRSQGKRVGLKAAIVSFYRVTNHASHGWRLLPLTKEEVSSIFSDNPLRQNHTISRLDRKVCLQPNQQKNRVPLKKKRVSKKHNADAPKHKYPQLGTHQIEVK